MKRNRRKTSSYADILRATQAAIKHDKRIVKEIIADKNNRQLDTGKWTCYAVGFAVVIAGLADWLYTLG